MMKPLYPEIEPFNTFYLQAGTQHQVYVEQCGNSEGIPVIFLHGGPCSGIRPEHRRFFNPQKYHIILFDQRGCGRSLPYGGLQDNTTQDIIADMEGIREQLGIEHWLVFGGSWGGTLALYYAQHYVARTMGLVIRGVFLARNKDLAWFGAHGAGRMFPEQWNRLARCLPQPETADFVDAICSVLWGNDELARLRVAKEWDNWSAQVALGNLFKVDPQDHGCQKLLLRVRMELNYARNRYFIEENQLLDQCGVLAEIPTFIIHGRHDLVCPPEAGYSLSRCLPQAELLILPNAGHIAQGIEMIDALVQATDKMHCYLA